MTKFLLLLFILILTCTVLSKNTKNLPGVIQDHGEMILIPEGDFLMGTSEEEIKKIAREFKKSYKYFLSETPEHKVFLSAYYIDKYEVSNRQYQKFIEAGGYENHIFWTEEGWIWKEKNVYEEPKWWLSGQNKSGINHPDYPVVGVSWYEAYAYAKWANKRLPTESEWEKASRGTEGFIYPWGMEWDINKSVSMGKEIQPVGSIEEGKSSYSVMDMSGNVWEWCSDWYDLLPIKIHPVQKKVSIKSSEADVVEIHIPITSDAQTATGPKKISGMPIRASDV